MRAAPSVGDNDQMSLVVREMAIDEVGFIIDYFHSATPEHLELMGVDPTRLPGRRQWREHYVAQYDKPPSDRSVALVVWELDGAAFGFSTADSVVRGEEARMHLHIVDARHRGSGLGHDCVRRTAALYMRVFGLKRVFSEPNAFNVAPNRTLQRAGFRYVKTHMTVPGPLNYHQAVTRWVLEP